MSDKVSPYRRWLGLSQQQPDYFQLLGIERSERRPAELRAAAEARLALLKAFQDPEGRSERKALADQIKLAFQTLSHPEKRRDYENSIGETSIGLSPPAPRSEAIPLALPLAAPAKLPESGAMPEAQPLPAKEGSVVPSPVLESESLVAVSQLDSKRKRRLAGRSRSKLVPLFALLLFLGGPLAVIGVVWLNSTSGRSANPSAQMTPDRLESPAGKPMAASKSNENAKTQELSVDTPEEVAAETKTGVDLADQSGAMGNQVPNLNQDGAALSIDDPNGPAGSSNGASAKESLGNEYCSPAMRDAFREIWNELFFRNLSQARTRLLVFKGTLSKPEEAVQLAALEEAVERADRFWQQVVKSSAEIRSGEFPFGDETAAFVESTDQFLMLKLKGVVVRANWIFLPKELAIQVAEQGMIPDIPRWRLDKATALLFEVGDATKNEQRIREWLTQSAQDGHETEALEWMLERRLSDRSSVSLPEAPTESALRPVIKELAERVPQKQLAQNNLAGRNAAIQELLEFTRVEADPMLRFVALEKIREHAIRKADLALCRQTLESQAAIYAMDVDALMLESANEMVPYVQSELQAELVCEAIVVGNGIGWPTFIRGSIAPRKLVKAEELARKQDLRQTLERIRYLTTEK